jgi:TetR/AcrR family transcriptional repressor of nem operon
MYISVNKNIVVHVMRNANATRENLLDTAIKLIWNSNYDRIGVNEICTQAGVTKGAFYHHFCSKADLFYEAGLHHWEKFRPEFDRIFSPSIPPLEQLENLISMIIDREIDAALPVETKVNGCPMVAACGMAESNENKVLEGSQEISCEILKYYISLVRNLKNEDLLTSDSDEFQIARLMYQYIQGLLIHGRVFNDLEADKTDLREALYRLIDLKQNYRHHAHKKNP